MANKTTPQPKTFEERVYDNYRAALTAFPRYTEAYAPARRQQARKVTVERYNIPYTEVKRIVRKFDALNGITHEGNTRKRPLTQSEQEHVELVERIRAYATSTSV